MNGLPRVPRRAVRAASGTGSNPDAAATTTVSATSASIIDFLIFLLVRSPQLSFQPPAVHRQRRRIKNPGLP